LPRRKLSDQPLTVLELEIMEVLWKTESADVRTVRARLKDHEAAYTTVQTILNVLQRKEKVTRRLQGRGYLTVWPQAIVDHGLACPTGS
jgi:BlaI family transcriptional regulator, penicillinase repressor